jgi:thioredoxin-related protein
MKNESTQRFPAIMVLALVLAASAPFAAADTNDIYDTKANGRDQIHNAVAKAKEEGKHVLITWGANWCGWCHHLKEQCEADDRITKLLDESYVAIRIDLGHRDKHMDLAREYDLEFKDLYIPHMTVLDAEGEVVGDQNPEDLAVEVPDGEGRRTVYSRDKIFEFLEANRPEKVSD